MIPDTSSCLFIYGHAFGIQSSHVNCKYSFSERFFTSLWKSFLHIFISESDLLPLDTNNPLSLFIPFYRTSLNCLLHF